VSEYLNQRQLALNVARSTGIDLGSFAEAGENDPTSPAWKLRAWLGSEGQRLAEQYPEFGPVYDEIFRREMVSDTATDGTIEIDWMAGS